MVAENVAENAIFLRADARLKWIYWVCECGGIEWYRYHRTTLAQSTLLGLGRGIYMGRGVRYVNAIFVEVVYYGNQNRSVIRFEESVFIFILLVKLGTCNMLYHFLV